MGAVTKYEPEHKKGKGKLAGKLLDLATGAAFLGSFFQNHLGQFFKGKSYGDNPEPLLFVPDKPAEEETDSKFFNRYIKPSDKDYENGKLTRFFVKDIPSGKCAELDKNAYIKQQKENKPYRKFYKTDWFVSGLLDDTTIKGYNAEGIKSKNAKLLDEAEKALPGIGLLLNNPSQFTKATLTQNNQGKIVSQEDLAGANSVENLQAKVGQFVLKGTDIPYNGLYHIHPVLGPMAGAKHIQAVHPRLDYIDEVDNTPKELLNQQGYAANQSIIETDQSSDGGTLRRSSY